MSRDWRVYLDDIVESADRIRGYLGGVGYEEFVADEKTYSAAIRHLMVIGEAAKKVPERIRVLAQEIPGSG